MLRRRRTEKGRCVIARPDPRELQMIKAYVYIFHGLQRFAPMLQQHMAKQDQKVFRELRSDFRRVGDAVEFHR